ncbi:MAG: hypothetical protein JXA94_03240 [Parachlamydiales bacterium]|nr:hypothetical protein [Parachlamydiales bacterium]
MKYLVLDSQINFYKEKGYIEFEEILKEEEILALENEIEILLKNQLGDLESASFMQRYLAGRDLFRKSEFIKKISLRKNLASIAANLNNKKSLRIGYDQAIFSIGKNPFEDMVSLDNISAFQGLICAVIIKLDSNEATTNSYLPSKRSNCIFVKNSFGINFEGIFANEQKFFMITYADLKTIYRLNKKDPCVNSLKKFGYVFGDVLKDEYNPIIY